MCSERIMYERHHLVALLKPNSDILQGSMDFEVVHQVGEGSRVVLRVMVLMLLRSVVC